MPTRPPLAGSRTESRGTPAAILLGLAAGAALPVTQRAAEPSTRPLDVSVGNDALPAPTVVPRAQTVGAFGVQPLAGLVSSQRGRYVLYLQPLLTFRSRSADRGWTLLARTEDRMGPGRALVGFRRDDAGIALAFKDDGVSRLSVRETASGGSVGIEAVSRLPRPVYSHLNTYCELEFAGHRRLFASFSPCAGARIEVTHSDYPVGDPSRFAYLGADGIFRVVQASSGEKGPFRTLAQGRMDRAEPLTIELFDEDRPVLRLTLLDWAMQASTDLSPTAGWRVPQNAIEFTRDTESPASPASFFVTLAATSVGRGFDTVGHAAGTYRNRMRVEWLEGATAEDADRRESDDGE
jgi:hypothetical protein